MLFMKTLVLSILVASAALAGPSVSIPFVFEKNAGQVDQQVRYFGRAHGSALWLVDSGAVLSVDQKNRRAVLRMTLEGARPHPRIEGTEPLAGKTNYFTGNDPAQWKRDISQYGAVRYQDAYPGVDLLFHASAQAIEYDWVVSPGADPRQIRMSFQGASEIRIDRSGDLVLRIGDVEVREKRPRIFQGAQQDAREIDGRFVRRGRAIGIEIANYDRSRTLTIDPVLTYATYLGGSGNVLNQVGDWAQAVAMDAQGNVIVTGTTASKNFPTSNGLYDVSPGSPVNAFIAKVNPSAATGHASLLWSTYLGGALTTQGYAVAVDSQSAVYVTGITEAPDFPLVNAFQTSLSTGNSCKTFQGNQVACLTGFVTKFSSAGDALLYSSFLGSTGGDNEPTAIAVDSAGSAWITGYTRAEGFPLAGNSIQNVLSSQQNGFVSQVSPTGSRLLYSTYLGGNSLDALDGITVDSAGNAYVVGWSQSTDFPMVNAYQAALLSNTTQAGVVVKINPNVRPSLVYSTYLGGANGGTQLNAVSVDTNGNVFVVGETLSPSFPVTANAIQTGAALGIEAGVVAELDPAAQAAAQLEYSTYLTGGFSDVATAIALDSTGRIVVAGGASVYFPTTPDAFQTSFGNGNRASGAPTKAYLAIIDPMAAGLKGLVYSTFYGGSQSETLDDMALNPAGTSATIVGQATSKDLFVTPNAYQPESISQFSEGFIATFALAQTGPTIAAMVNAASFAAPNANFAPGEIVTLFGSNLGPQALVGAELDATGHLASTLAGCQLLVNRTPAPLVYVQANQVSAILPYELTPLIGGSLNNYAQMVCNSVPGNVFEFLAVAADPAIFSAASNGTGQAAVLNQDGSYNSASNAAAAGSIVTIFETGEGVLTPAGQDGRIETGALSTIPKPALPVTVTFGTIASPKITYAAVAPDEVDGLLQIDAQVPSGLTPGDVPIVVTIGKTASPAGLTIAVK
jgi:uncharacterized protein (TIGR03437 family)